VSKDILKVEDRANPNYRTWMYKKVDGEVESVIVGMDEAEALYAKDWRLSPAEFHDELGQDSAFQSAANDFAGKMNQLINLDLIDDKSALIELGELYGLKLKNHMSKKNMKFRITEASKLEELL
jgi:hypothetical protein